VKVKKYSMTIGFVFVKICNANSSEIMVNLFQLHKIGPNIAFTKFVRIKHLWPKSWIIFKLFKIPRGRN